MAKIYISSVVAAPVEKVWQYIRDFNSLPKWFPGVTDSKIEAGMRSDQVGCVRDFGLEGGERMRERLLELSDRDHSCTYTVLQAPMPVSNYIARVRLLPITDGDQTFAEYAVEFDCAQQQESELTGELTKVYQGALEHLKQHTGKS